MKRLRIITIVGLVLSALLLAGVTLYQRETGDQTIPVIQCPDTPLVLSLTGEGREELLADVTAFDEKDGDLTDRLLLQGVDKGADGTMAATYAVADSDGHVVTRTREVRYTDYTPPRFALQRELRYSAGAAVRVRDRLTAYDMVDGDISSRIKVISGTTSYDEGTYPVTFQVTNSLGDTASVTLDVVVRSYAAGEPRIELKEYLIYQKLGDRLNPMDYLKSVSGGDAESVTAALPEGGLKKGVNAVRYTCPGGTEGSAVLYVVCE
ncbi:hypothetical protein [Dysosmobacter sp.]|uniref:hypothetical protein n=1 Tax=Dysosmobacter sp. TaxID=2591382 RepID=UPI002A8F72EF|nr:hypothetical protein [Dysosmobacter sp.]MDY3281428.1 hypothetical protein [Dysosmobacter sp.]